MVIPKGCDEGFVRSVHTQHKDATLIRVFMPKAGGKQGEGFVAGFAVQHYAGEVSGTAEAATPAPLHHPCTHLTHPSRRRTPPSLPRLVGEPRSPHPSLHPPLHYSCTTLAPTEGPLHTAVPLPPSLPCNR